jgi:Peptidase family M1 domain
MPTRRRSTLIAVASAALVLPGLASTTSAVASTSDARHCSAGAHTLSPPGSRVYPETGNGGYTSLHTLVHLLYDPAANRFLPGTSVVLTERATQCLSSFSLDFEPRSHNVSGGPDMTVQSVTVNGRRSAFGLVQPTYPGDPAGPQDPDPAAHEASQDNPVGGPHHNPLPPACSPELMSGRAADKDSLDGTQCPTTKLLVTPPSPVANGSVFTVTVSYTGRPGLHNDGDGSTEGWFRASDGGFVTTEPVGSEDWMPLNDYPTAKPTYDFSDTVPAGRVAVANGVLVSVVRHPANRQFPGGSETWSWHSAAPVASYLVEDSIGKYTLSVRTAADGIRFYEAQDAAISPAMQKKNLAIMNMQEEITAFESRFTGPFPFSSDGVVIGTPDASFEEEMQTMITFAGGTIDTDVLYHENMHQWWGDNVTEGGYRLTFFKEGMATLAEFLYAARQAQAAAGGPGSASGRAAFQATLNHVFDSIYRIRGSFWTAAPSNPDPYGLFSGAATYARPGAAYVALRQILGHANFTQALEQIQRTYGGGSISEAQLEAVFHQWLPVTGAACQERLSQFFTQWFDTEYPAGGGVNRPQITGPGLAGPGFYGATGTCEAARHAQKVG